MNTALCVSHPQSTTPLPWKWARWVSQSKWLWRKDVFFITFCTLDCYWLLFCRVTPCQEKTAVSSQLLWCSTDLTNTMMHIWWSWFWGNDVSVITAIDRSKQYIHGSSHFWDYSLKSNEEFSYLEASLAMCMYNSLTLSCINPFYWLLSDISHFWIPLLVYCGTSFHIHCLCLDICLRII